MKIADVEQNLTTALKSRDTITASTLRLLLSRLKNERIAAGGELSADAVMSIVQSEYKKRKEAAEEFTKGNRAELAAAELNEAAVLQQLLPPQASEADILHIIDTVGKQEDWHSKDFGLAMKKLKEHFGAAADGALIARLLKEKLN